jgi:hypothetical protein
MTADPLQSVNCGKLHRACASHRRRWQPSTSKRGFMNANTLAVLSLLSAAMPDNALAQASPPLPLQAFIASQQFQAYIGNLFSRLPPDVFRRCGSLVSKVSTVSQTIPPVFASDGHPVSGAWKQSFPVSGCGNDTVINFFFAAQSSEKIVTILGAPGDTHADAALQKDADRDVVLATRLRAPACADPHVLNTTYDGRDTRERRKEDTPAQSDKAPWQETWTMSACSQIVKVRVNFVPDLTGTTISIEAIREAHQD